MMVDQQSTMARLDPPMRAAPPIAPFDASNPPGRLAQFIRMVDAFERDEIELAVDGLIAMLDRRDGDADTEDEGHDEPDGTGQGDPSWPEWQQRGRRKLVAGSYEDRPRDVGSYGATEDDEDGGDTELNGDELDGCGSEDDFMVHAADGPGCLLADPGGGDDPEREPDLAPVRRWHRDRIRRTRCDQHYRGGEVFYALRPMVLS